MVVRDQNTFLINYLRNQRLLDFPKLNHTDKHEWPPTSMLHLGMQLCFRNCDSNFMYRDEIFVGSRFKKYDKVSRCHWNRKFLWLKSFCKNSQIC